MELSHVERRRTELLQFVLLVIILVLAVITYLSFKQEQGYLIPALAALCLCACLYVIGKERYLKQLQSDLVEQLLEKERQVTDEQAKSSSLEVRLKELTDLYRAISTVNSGLDPERTFDTVLRAALELVGGNRGSVMLVDEDSDFLRIVSSQGLSEAVVAQTRQEMGHGIAGWVAENGEPVLMSGSARDDERFRDALAREEEILYSLSVPLTLRNKIMGVLNLGVTPDQDADEFSEQELRIATIFAQHASVAIENARLMKDVVGSMR
jgi:two-component system NtrC family sensor kinase